MIKISFNGQDRREKVDRDKGRNLLEFLDNYIVFDTETTGLDPYYDSIIEVAAIKYKNGEEVERFQELVNPQYGISSFITDLTGITNEMLKDARDELAVLRGFYDFVGDSVVIALHAHFDLNFLYDGLLENYNIKFDNDFVDTMRIARRLLDELDHHRLKDLAKYYGYEYQGGHRAEFDAELTAKIFKTLRSLAIEKYGSIEEFSKRQSAYYGQ
ncbi:hypothetical protein HMPREF2758_04795 [Facklamia sp. HMSC062C11]|uniref:3'-5' exonuclease n=1 Tax=Facklamia sp. HMSC062C11 TaxID=1739262 RepID=UPI0008ADE8FA|nr:exonuclease domain-containing protein [Facklamia sp. HMSC062C11]OFL63310.1 hypothetical protein HMPREF2758_04795 [Facklamia sp. HMSC062C11]